MQTRASSPPSGDRGDYYFSHLVAPSSAIHQQREGSPGYLTRQRHDQHHSQQRQQQNPAALASVSKVLFSWGNEDPSGGAGMYAGVGGCQDMRMMDDDRLSFARTGNHHHAGGGEHLRGSRNDPTATGAGVQEVFYHSPSYPRHTTSSPPSSFGRSSGGVSFGTSSTFLRCREMNTDPHLPNSYITDAHPSDVGKLVCVLDLDETLVYARGGGAGSHGMPPIVVRPGATELLRSIGGDVDVSPSNSASAGAVSGSRCELILWTAAIREPALVCLEKLDPRCTLFRHLIYRHPKWWQGYKSFQSKQARNLNRPMHRVVVVDNIANCMSDNPENGILVSDFEGDLREDDGSVMRDLRIVLEELVDARHANVPSFLASHRLLVKRWVPLESDGEGDSGSGVGEVLLSTLACDTKLPRDIDVWRARLVGKAAAGSAAHFGRDTTSAANNAWSRRMMLQVQTPPSARFSAGLQSDGGQQRTSYGGAQHVSPVAGLESTFYGGSAPPHVPQLTGANQRTPSVSRAVSVASTPASHGRRLLEGSEPRALGEIDAAGGTSLVYRGRFAVL